jgi:hypothetical protein
MIPNLSTISGTYSDDDDSDAAGHVRGAIGRVFIDSDYHVSYDYLPEFNGYGGCEIFEIYAEGAKPTAYAVITWRKLGDGRIEVTAQTGVDGFQLAGVIAKYDDEHGLTDEATTHTFFDCKTPADVLAAFHEYTARRGCTERETWNTDKSPDGKKAYMLVTVGVDDDRLSEVYRGIMYAARTGEQFRKPLAIAE